MNCICSPPGAVKPLGHWQSTVCVGLFCDQRYPPPSWRIMRAAGAPRSTVIIWPISGCHLEWMVWTRDVFWKFKATTLPGKPDGDLPNPQQNQPKTKNSSSIFQQFPTSASNQTNPLGFAFLVNLRSNFSRIVSKLLQVWSLIHRWEQAGRNSLAEADPSLSRTGRRHWLGRLGNTQHFKDPSSSLAFLEIEHDKSLGNRAEQWNGDFTLASELSNI